jgi:hypothetical protein
MPGQRLSIVAGALRPRDATWTTDYDKRYMQYFHVFPIDIDDSDNLYTPVVGTLCLNSGVWTLRVVQHDLDTLGAWQHDRLGRESSLLKWNRTRDRLWNLEIQCYIVFRLVAFPFNLSMQRAEIRADCARIP